MCRYLCKFFILSFLLVGCAVTLPSVSQIKIMQLSQLLQSLDENTTEKEATSLSQNIFYETQKLTKEFELTSPPLFHNFLVNVGIREKGLCYHWSDALYLHLSEKTYSSFRFHLIGTHIGEYWYEHNALVVVAQNSIVDEGVIIDPWRDSGKLYFSKVKYDSRYQWKHRVNRCCRR